MSEDETQAELSFMQTPLKFFGHSSETIHFDYPAVYYEEIEELNQEAAVRLEEIEARRELLLLGEAPKDRYESRLLDDQEFTLIVDEIKRQPLWQHNHNWYERRFRGSSSKAVRERHSEVTNYFDSLIGNKKDQLSVPDSDNIVRYLNDRITSNEWSGAAYDAREWHDALPEDHPDRAVAANYAGFAGNIMLNQYCKLAIALADDSLADDDFVSVKHFFSVCLPTANRLESFIPEEVRTVKQVLREVFMQYALRSGNTVRRYAEMFGRIELGHEMTGSYDERDANEDEALSAIMRYDESEHIDRDKMVADLLNLTFRLEAQHEWSRAIDVLDLARFAFDIPTDMFQGRIDELAINGVLHYTTDMSRLNERWSYTRGKHEYWTDNGEKLVGLEMSSCLSDEARRKMREIKDIRGLEHALQALEASEDIDRQHALRWEIMDKLASAAPELASRYGQSEFAEKLLEQIKEPSLMQISASGFDDFVEKLLILKNKGVLTAEQRNEAIMTMVDNLVEASKSPKYERPFERFIGLISPLLRGTEPADNADEETVWVFAPKAQFVSLMETYIERVNDKEFREWLSLQKTAFCTNVREAWKNYWDEFEEYAW